MGNGHQAGSNKLGGGYAAPGADLRRRPVLNTWGAGVPGEIGAVGGDPVALVRSIGGGSSHDGSPIGPRGVQSRNGGNPPFLAGRFAYVARAVVARCGERPGTPMVSDRCRLIGDLTTPRLDAATGGVAVASWATPDGGCDPLDRRAPWDHPRRACEPSRFQRSRPARPADLYWQSVPIGTGRTFAAEYGVGGLERQSRVDRISAKPNSIRAGSGRGASSGGVPKMGGDCATLSGGKPGVN